MSAASCRRPCLASAAAAPDDVVLVILLVVVKPTPNLEIFVLSVLRNWTRLDHVIQASFSLGPVLYPGAHSCPSALPPTDNARRVGDGWWWMSERFSALEPHGPRLCSQRDNLSNS